MTTIQRTRKLALAAKRRTLLAARPSWITGAARLVDLGSTFNRYAIVTRPAKTEAEAVAGDWTRVGADLHHAMERVAVPSKSE